VLHETTCNQDLADKIECALINEFKTNVPEFGYNMTAGGNTKDVVKFTPEMCAKISAAKLGKLLIVRRLKTQEEDRPIIDLFKAGKSRHEIEIELGVSKAKIQKALARWKERVDPNLPVGRNFWRHSSGLTLQKRADELNQPIVDLVAQGLSYKDVASQLNITRCKVRTAMQRYNRRKHASK
jgi:transposase